MKIFLISGKQGSGKTTLARAIRENYLSQGAKYQGLVYSLRFAQPLYELHDAVYGVMARYGYSLSDAKDGDLLQLLGTDWGRKKLGPNVWVQCLLNNLRALPAAAVVTIEDCRFINEFEAFNSVPGTVRIRLEAAESARQRRASFWRKDTSHKSETDLDLYAENDKFDMIFDTEHLTTDSMVKLLDFEGRFD